MTSDHLLYCCTIAGQNTIFESFLLYWPTISYSNTAANSTNNIHGYNLTLAKEPAIDECGKLILYPPLRYLSITIGIISLSKGVVGFFDAKRKITCSHCYGIGASTTSTTKTTIFLLVRVTNCFPLCNLTPAESLRPSFRKHQRHVSSEFSPESKSDSSCVLQCFVTQPCNH